MQTGQASVDVIISYSRNDSDFVDRLEADLKAQNLTVWVDRRKLEGGQVWDTEIQGAIDHCRVLLMVISPAALESPWVTKEYQYALKRHKEVIPLRYHPTGELPPELQKLQWVDFQLTMNFEATYPAHLQELLKAITFHIERFNARENAREALRQARRTQRDQHKALRLAGGIALYTLLIVLLGAVTARIFFPAQIVKFVPVIQHVPILAIPVPSVAGTYQGTYTTTGRLDTNPIQIQISQSDTQLSGTITYSSYGTIFSDLGTIDPNGNFTITVYFPNAGTGTWHGSIEKQGYLSGTWTDDSGSGHWSVTLL
jgi:hypothetical protein